MALAGFAEGELASAEFALDGLNYADIVGVAVWSASALASLAQVVGFSGAATQVLTPESLLNALVTQPALAVWTQASLGALAPVLQARAAGTWTAQAQPALVRVTGAYGAAEWRAVSVAEIANTDIWGYGSWAQTGYCVAGLLAHTAGAASWGDTTTGVVSQVVGSTTAAQWRAASDATTQSVKPARSDAWWRAAATAPAGARAWLDAAASWSVATGASFAAVRGDAAAAGFAQVGFGQAAYSVFQPCDGAALGLASGAGWVSGVMQAIGAARCGAAGAALGHTVCNTRGAALWLADAAGRPGGKFMTALPAARERFAVAAMGAPWAVAPDPELNEV